MHDSHERPSSWEQRVTVAIPGYAAAALSQAALRERRDFKSQLLVMLEDALRQSGDLADRPTPPEGQP
jgi:hypothetical protein